MSQELSVKEIIEQELSREKVKLPISDQVAVNLNNLLSREDISHKDIADLLEKDPSLTAKIINLANSPLYSGLVKIKTIEQALTRLGVKTVKNFLMTITFKDVFTSGGERLREQFKLNWKHSLACGICSKKIAEECDLNLIADDAYMLGLIHDIGVITILDIIVELHKRKDLEITLHDELIMEIIDSFHAHAGVRILEHMNFDEKLCNIVACHHEPDTYKSPDEPLFNILLVADQLVKKIGFSLAPAPEISILSLPSASKLGLDPLFVSQIEVDLEDMFQDVNNLF